MNRNVDASFYLNTYKRHHLREYPPKKYSYEVLRHTATFGKQIHFFPQYFINLTNLHGGIADERHHTHEHVFSNNVNMDQYTLTYESKLPFMFELIGSQSQTRSGEHGMTDLQAELWRVVWEKKVEINSDMKHRQTPTVVRQFYLEVEVWGTFCKSALAIDADHFLINQGTRKTFPENIQTLLSLNQ
jgi:hypothetical protein